MFFKHFEDLEAWQCSRAFIKKIYLLTNTPRFSRDWGLKDQVRRASVSIILNIAEGFDSKSKQAFINFLRYSYRSSAEVKSTLYIILDLEYITEVQFTELSDDLDLIQKLLAGLIKSLQK